MDGHGWIEKKNKTFGPENWANVLILNIYINIIIR